MTIAANECGRTCSPTRAQWRSRARSVQVETESRAEQVRLLCAGARPLYITGLETFRWVALRSWRPFHAGAGVVALAYLFVFHSAPALAVLGIVAGTTTVLVILKSIGGHIRRWLATSAE
jgi:hypothetical protein